MKIQTLQTISYGKHTLEFLSNDMVRITTLGTRREDFCAFADLPKIVQGLFSINQNEKEVSN